VPDDIAATQEPKGPGGPVDASWLILQRLDDLRRAQDDLRRAQDELKNNLLGRMAELKADLQGQINDLKKDVAWVRNYALSIVLIAVLGLLARSFIR
jgi:hypothetical protein